MSDTVDEKGECVRGTRINDTSVWAVGVGGGPSPEQASSPSARGCACAYVCMYVHVCMCMCVCACVYAVKHARASKCVERMRESDVNRSEHAVVKQSVVPWGRWQGCAHVIACAYVIVRACECESTSECVRVCVCACMCAYV